MTSSIWDPDNFPQPRLPIVKKKAPSNWDLASPEESKAALTRAVKKIEEGLHAPRTGRHVTVLEKKEEWMSDEIWVKGKNVGAETGSLYEIKFPNGYRLFPEAEDGFEFFVGTPSGLTEEDKAVIEAAEALASGEVDGGALVLKAVVARRKALAPKTLREKIEEAVTDNHREFYAADPDDSILNSPRHLEYKKNLADKLEVALKEET